MRQQHGLHDLARHNVWATRQLLTFCQGLDPATLETTAPGTYGSIIGTLNHIITAETSYLYRMTGAWSSLPWSRDEQVDLQTLGERAEILATVLEEFLAGDWDSERLGEARGGDGTIFAIPAGIFLTQLLHHANEHRAQIGTMLGVLGLDPPDVSAWGYARATGRSTIKSSPADSAPR